MAKILSKLSFSRFLFLGVAILCCTPYVSAAIALMLGIGLSVTFGNPYLAYTRQWTHRLLQLSIVGLGAGMNLSVIGQAGIQGAGYTAIGIFLTFLVGTSLGKLLKTDDTTSLLVTVGTAICGGSAIAAVASTIRAKSQEVSVALATVFFLNASALILFPGIGHFFALSERQFGLWSALAIHDTSSVVGAALQYGSHATEVATTVKLARALWIVPVSFAVGLLWKDRQESRVSSQTKRPWFILGFLLAAAWVTWIPSMKPIGILVNSVAKRTLVLTLFLIGGALTRETIKSVGIRPFIQGLCLWVIMASTTLGAILLKWIE